MKKQMKHFMFCFISFSSLFIQSCNKDYDLCEGKPETEIKKWQYVDADAMKLYPYKGNEILTFISNKGDTAVLVGKGQLFKYPKLRYSGNNDCTDFYDEHEILFTEFVGDNPNFNHLRLEVAKREDHAIILKPFINGRTGIFDYWTTAAENLFAMNVHEFSNIKFNYKDSMVLAFRVSLPLIINDPFPVQVILYKSVGVIGLIPDSSTIYTLQ